MNKMDFVRMQSAKLSSNQATALKVGMKYATSPVTRVGIEAGLGAAAGVGAAMFDKEDDDLGSFAKKGVIAAGAGYAATEGLAIGAAKYARSDHFANLAADLITKKSPMLANHKTTVGSMVNTAAKKVVPSMNRKLGIGGAGMAAGLIFTMMNGQQDGMLDTGTNMITGAGLALMGGQVFDSFNKKKKTETKKSMFGKKVDKFFQTNTGATVQKSMQDLLKTDAGKNVSAELSRIFATKDGQALASVFHDSLNGKVGNLFSVDGEQLQKSVFKVEQELQGLLRSEKGMELMKRSQEAVLDETKRISPQLMNNLQQDMRTTMETNLLKTKQSLQVMSGVYGSHTTEINKVLDQMLPGQSGHVNQFMNEKVPEIIKQIDKKVPVNTSQAETKAKKEAPTKKAESIIQATEESEGVVKKADSVLKAGKLEQETAKVKHNLSMEDQMKIKKMKGWASKGKLAGLIGLGVFATASVIDTNNGLSENRDVSRMKEKQEKNLTRKLKREEKQQSQYAYGHVDMGEMAFQMFNERLGHHKMGNAKFQ